MTDTTTQPSGQNAAGSADATTDTTTNGGASGDNGGDGAGSGNDTVSYDTHRRLLAEKKRMQQERDKLAQELAEKRKAEEAAERERLEKQGEYKKLLENERKAREELESKLNQHTQTQRQAKKLGAVLDALGGAVPKKFWGLIDTETVAIDPDTGDIDAMSVQKTVEAIRAEYPEIIRKGGNGSSLPADAPAGNGSAGTLTPETWKNLSLADQKKRLPEYVEMLKAQATQA